MMAKAIMLMTAAFFAVAGLPPCADDSARAARRGSVGAADGVLDVDMWVSSLMRERRRPGAMPGRLFLG